MKIEKSDFVLEKIVILGLGLLGASICKKLKEINSNIFITACGRNREKLIPPLEEGIIDEVITYNDLLPVDADLYVIATPVEKSINIIQNVLDTVSFKSNTLVVDVGSVKQGIIESIKEHKKSNYFIGCHPMAGSEKSGYNFSSASLYQNAAVIITPHEKNDLSDIEKIISFWELLGASCHIVDAKLHDEIISFTSHLPHIISAALVISVAGNQKDHFSGKLLQSFIGGGFRSMTRIAEGSVDVWKEIISMNISNISNALEVYIEILRSLHKKIKDNDIQDIKEFLAQAVELKKELVL